MLLRDKLTKELFHGHFPIIPLLNSMLKNGSQNMAVCYIQIHVITRFVIKGLHCSNIWASAGENLSLRFP